MRTRWRIVSVIALVLLAIAGAYCIELALPKHDYFLERAGSLSRADVRETTTSPAIGETLHLESSSGLQVDMRILRPANSSGQKLPLLLVLGGYMTGKDAVDLVGEPDGIAYAAIDYPYQGSQALSEFWASVAAIPDVQRAFLDSPAAVSLALEWLLQQPWVDPERVELVGVSLGVPFAAAAGAVDRRFKRVWLMHGGGDNGPWVMHNARDLIENDTLRYLVSNGVLFLVYGNSFDTRSRIPQIAPRPVIIVAARDDDFVPYSAQESLIEAAKSEHVELVWTEGRHIGPRREEELQRLLEIVTSRVRPVR